MQISFPWFSDSWNVTYVLCVQTEKNHLVSYHTLFGKGGKRMGLFKWPFRGKFIDARYRLVLNDTDISSWRSKFQYRYRYQSLILSNSIPISIPILTYFIKDTNTNINTLDFQKRYQYQYQYLRFSNVIPIPISIPKYCDTRQSRVKCIGLRCWMTQLVPIGAQSTQRNPHNPLVDHSPFDSGVGDASKT